ncbi:MAG: 3-deoxy-7-phosphoheptulonate synthase [Bacillota bacterium]
MVIVVKGNRENQQVDELIRWIESRDFTVQVNEGVQKTILGVVGDTAALDIGAISSFPAVEDVKRIQEPYKKANRVMHEDDTVVDICGVKIGGGHFEVMAGPCSIETKEQVLNIADYVKKHGGAILRGGAFKPRTSPYAFQGLKGEGLELMIEAKKRTGMPIVSELMSLDDLDLFENVDIIQIGARNMQNFAMLRELGRIRKPILLKRGIASTVVELLLSAEYIMAGGNNDIILCERGIRTFETYTRSTLDISAIPVLKKLTHLPVIVDPSHASGRAELVESLALASIAAGADGLIIETHNNPKCALCDGAQSLNEESFSKVMTKVNKLKNFMKTLK